MKVCEIRTAMLGLVDTRPELAPDLYDLDTAAFDVADEEVFWAEGWDAGKLADEVADILDDDPIVVDLRVTDGPLLDLRDDLVEAIERQNQQRRESVRRRLLAGELRFP